MRHFRDGRLPTWCWSTVSGATLSRKADVVDPSNLTQENAMLEIVRKSHPDLLRPFIMDLTKNLPSAKDVNQSFNKLRELCAPGLLTCNILCLLLFLYLFICFNKKVHGSFGSRTIIFTHFWKQVNGYNMSHIVLALL